jgi:uncharacterized protein YneF (UPF0154 family)
MAGGNTNDDRLMESSKQALSMLYKKRTAEELLGLQRIYRWVIAAWLPLAILVIIYASLWADIQAKNTSFGVTADWEACMTQADYQYIPLKEMIGPQVATKAAATKTTLSSCIGTLWTNQVCSDDCVTGIVGTCVPQLPTISVAVNDPALPTGKFLAGLSAIGVQAVIFSAAGHASMRRALVHPSWLPSTIALLIWFVFAIFSYYTISPVLPVPNQTNSTLLMYIYYYSSYYKFTNFNGGDNHCAKAYGIAWSYILILLLIVLSLVIAAIVGIYAERIRYKTLKKHYEPLNHTEIPVTLAVLAIMFYLILNISKMTTGFTELNAINNFNLSINQAAAEGYTVWYPQIWFPFAQPFFDLSTLLGILSLMSILRGYTIQSISAFRLSFIASLVFTITTYPGIVGAYEFYNYRTFSNDESCKDFFTATGKEIFFCLIGSVFYSFRFSLSCFSYLLLRSSCTFWLSK